MVKKVENPLRARKKLKDSQKARAAVAAFREMQPVLTSYAQVLTGDKRVRVVLSSSNGSTDGTNIFFRPPLSLGEKHAHERWNCDKRGANQAMLCPACAQRDQVMATIYHEIAHIWFGSFAKISRDAQKYAIQESVVGGFSDDTFTKEMKSRLENARPGINYMQLANLISPWMQPLLNALEDARIENMLFSALPGTRVMLQVDVSRVFTEGVEGRNPITGEWESVHWRDRPLNQQVLVALYCKVSGYDYQDWFNEWVVKTLDDPDLEKLLAQVGSAKRIDGVFTTAFPILRLLRSRYGYFKSETDPDDPETGEEGSGEGKAPEGGESEKSSASGDDSEGSDDSSGGEDAWSSDSSELPDGEEGEEVDETPGGGAGKSGPSGRSDDLEDSDEGSGGDGDSAGGSESSSPDSDGDSGSTDVHEEVSGADEAGSLESSEPGNSGDPGDDISSGSGLDGLSDELPGTEVVDRPSGNASRPAGDGRDDAEDGFPEVVIVKPDIEFGDEAEIDNILAEATGHPETGKHGEHSHDVRGDEDDEQVRDIIVVIEQGDAFDEVSSGLSGMVLLRPGDPSFRGGNKEGLSANEDASRRLREKYMPPESVLARSVMEARLAFADNARGKYERGLVRGRVNSASLANRAPFNDPRMFEKKRLPGRQSYFVGIGLDISGSTMGWNLEMIKKLAFAEAEMLYRIGIPFFMYAHTGGGGRFGGYELQIHEIKSPNDPWSDSHRNILAGMNAGMANLDGHTLEFYRKQLDKRTETTRILHYYTDGKMPLENYTEELMVLSREINTMRKSGYHLTGIGVRTDSPKGHGLHTVEVNDVTDLALVVADLRKSLIGR